MEREDEQQSMVQQGPPAPPKCPFCFKEVRRVSWLTDPQSGLVTFYHDEPDCRIVLGCQLVMIQRRVALPNELRPHGLG